MSATIHKLAERTYRPTNIEDAIRIVDMRPGDGGYHLAVARFALGAIEASQEKRQPNGDPTPAECQLFINRLFIAWFALGEALGVPRDAVLDDDFLPGGAA